MYLYYLWSPGHFICVFRTTTECCCVWLPFGIHIRNSVFHISVRKPTKLNSCSFPQCIQANTEILSFNTASYCHAVSVPMFFPTLKAVFSTSSYIYIYIYIYIHTHTHIYTYICIYVLPALWTWCLLRH